MPEKGVLMVKKIFPGGVLHGYFLDSEIHKAANDDEYYPVSYTHLTLPTILLV